MIINPYIFSVYTYPVDEFSIPIAYSLRKVSSTATNCIRVRRDSDNTEQDIGFVGNDFDASAVSSFCGAGNGYVVKWYNQGTTGATDDISQSTAANQPVIQDAGTVVSFHGNYAVRFNAINNRHLVGSALSELNAEPLSYFIVHDNLSTTTGGTFMSIFSTGDGTSSNSRLQIYPTSNTTTQISTFVRNTSGTNTFVSPGSAISINTPYLRSGIIDSSKGMESWRNGSSEGTNTFSGTYVNATLEVGSNNSTQYSNGKISELFIFGTDESSNRADIETNINDYYSIF